MDSSDALEDVRVWVDYCRVFVLSPDEFDSMLRGLQMTEDMLNEEQHVRRLEKELRLYKSDLGLLR